MLYSIVSLASLNVFRTRALRSLPLSVMLSGNLYWVYGNPDNRGTYGHFWSSTPYSYTDSRLLVFGSTNVYSKSGYAKPGGFTLRCVAFSSLFKRRQKQFSGILFML